MREGEAERARRDEVAGRGRGDLSESWAPIGAEAHLTRLNPPELAPATGFSHAVVGSGTVVFLAGQTALDAAGRIVGDTIVEQFRTALGNLLGALGAAGGRPSDLASLTVYLTDIPDYRTHAREIGRVWRELVGGDYPAMAAIGVARLWDDEAMVEIAGHAVLPGSQAGRETQPEVTETT